MNNNLTNNILQSDSTNLILRGTGYPYAPFELKLQLHGQVSNPHTVIIKTGYKASALLTVTYTKKEYRSPGTYSLSLPSSVTKIKVQVAGAGGCGGGSQRHSDGGATSGTGGTGELVVQTLTVSSGATCSITVGQGGGGGNNGYSAASSGNPGSAGGASSVKIGSTTVTGR